MVLGFGNFWASVKSASRETRETKGESSTGTVAEGREDGEEPSQGIATSIEVLLLQLQLRFGITST